MSAALGLTGVPTLSPTGKPLDEYPFDISTHTPTPPWLRTTRMYHYSLPLTPEASPCDWGQDFSRGPTPPGHVSATHPPGAPLYGLGLSPSLFEEDADDELQVISIGGPRRLQHNAPDSQAAPPLDSPPFIHARPKRTTSPLLEWASSSILSPGPRSLRQRRKRAQLFRNLVWAVVVTWALFFIFMKVTGSLLVSGWMKRNAQWSAQLNQFTGDSLSGLEDDFTPSTPPAFFHRTQRHQYSQYIANKASAETVPSQGQEIERSPLTEDDLQETEDSYFSSDAPVSVDESAAISEIIDNMLSWPDIEAYTWGRGDPRKLYREALVTMNDIDSITDLGGEELLSLLKQTDERRRRALESTIRLVRAGVLPAEWRSDSTFESLMRRIWTQNDYSDIFSGGSDPGSDREVVVFTRDISPRLLRLKKLLRTYRDIEPIFINLAERDDGDIIETLLGRLTGHDAIPHLIVGSESIGGWHEIMVFQSEGSLEKRLSAKRR